MTAWGWFLISEERPPPPFSSPLVPGVEMGGNRRPALDVVPLGTLAHRAQPPGTLPSTVCRRQLRSPGESQMGITLASPPPRTTLGLPRGFEPRASLVIGASGPLY